MTKRGDNLCPFIPNHLPLNHAPNEMIMAIVIKLSSLGILWVTYAATGRAMFRTWIVEALPKVEIKMDRYMMMSMAFRDVYRQPVY